MRSTAHPVLRNRYTYAIRVFVPNNPRSRLPFLFQPQRMHQRIGAGLQLPQLHSLLVCGASFTAQDVFLKTFDRSRIEKFGGGVSRTDCESAPSHSVVSRTPRSLVG